MRWDKLPAQEHAYLPLRILCLILVQRMSTSWDVCSACVLLEQSATLTVTLPTTLNALIVQLENSQDPQGRQFVRTVLLVNLLLVQEAPFANIAQPESTEMKVPQDALTVGKAPPAALEHPRATLVTTSLDS